MDQSCHDRNGRTRNKVRDKLKASTQDDDDKESEPEVNWDTETKVCCINGGHSIVELQVEHRYEDT